MCDSSSQSSRFDEVRVFIRKTFSWDEQLLIIIGKTKKERSSSFPRTFFLLYQKKSKKMMKNSGKIQVKNIFFNNSCFVDHIVD